MTAATTTSTWASINTGASGSYPAPNPALLTSGPVAVLYGGPSTEREVSLESGARMHEALVRKGVDARLIDAGPDLASQLSTLKPSCAVLGLHGRYGEDGCVQGLLEWLRIPYTGTGIAGSAMAMDKALARRLFGAAGLPIAEGVALEKTPALVAAITSGEGVPPPPFGLPCVVKPATEGSSVGVTIVREQAQWLAALRLCLPLGGAIIVERFMPGAELTCAWLCGEVLGTCQIVPKAAFYDYEAKYKSDDTAYLVPAPVAPAVEAQIFSVTARVNQIVGARGATRTDFIVGEDGTLTLLELNTLPGMTGHSLVPMVAKHRGLSFDDLVGRIAADAALKA
jgi:D-alanine-D-alanine ligase